MTNYVDYTVNGQPFGVIDASNGNWSATGPANRQCCCDTESLPWDSTWAFDVDDTTALDLGGVVFSERPSMVRLYIDGCAIIERRNGAPAPSADGSTGLALVSCGCCQNIELECDEIDNFQIISTTGNTATVQVEAYKYNC